MPLTSSDSTKEAEVSKSQTDRTMGGACEECAAKKKAQPLIAGGGIANGGQNQLAHSADAPGEPKIPSQQGDEAFHYSRRTVVSSIEKQGLRPGSYATPAGDLSPLQAQIDLALPPNRGLPDAVLRVDLAGLRKAGYEVPSVTQVRRAFNMPGGGYEMQFPYPIPPEFITVIRR